MGPPPTAHGRPGIAAYPSAATAYPSGAAGEPDQPLAEKFYQLPMGAAPGAGGQPQADPDKIPRPTPDELADPLRMEVRGDLDANEVMVHPKFIRLSVSSMPQSTSTKTKAALPIGAVIQPLANPPEMPVPLVNFGQTGVVRCRRCRTYVNAYVKFIDGGRRWRCNVCGLANDVPGDYYCDLDPDGRRRDRAERPELHMSSVEFVAAQEYMVRPPQPPVYLFVMEASYASVQSGMLRCVATTLTHTLDRLPGVGNLVATQWIRLAAWDPQNGGLAVYESSPSGGTFVPYVPEDATLPTAAMSADWFRGRRDHLPLARIIGRDRSLESCP
jgi:protein transport protein SEC24